MDSNHRRHSQQIYSLSHLATLELLRIQLGSLGAPTKAVLSFCGERKKEPADMELSPPGGNGMEQVSSDVELVDGLEPPTC